MRKISVFQTVIFLALSSLAIASAGLVVWLIYPFLSYARGFLPIIASLIFALLIVLTMIAAFRLLLAVRPLPAGDIAPRSPEETTYHIYLLFFLMVFYQIMKSNLIPVPILRVFYLALGARLGENTYSGGILFDPPFISIGTNTLVGHGALIIPHIIEGQRLAHLPIRIGSNVTIGANAVILADVEIGDNAIIAIGSVVTKGSRIGAGETWGGTPARRLRLATI